MNTKNPITRHGRDRRHSGLSTIELLAVIAIIAVLFGILFHISQKVRESSRSARCASNLRQIGLVMQLYMAENRGWTPPAVYTTTGENSYWNAWRRSLEPYIDINSDVFRCPTGTAEYGRSNLALYRMQPRANTASPQAWHPHLAPARAYNTARPQDRTNMVLLLDTRPHHGADKSPLLFFDNSVRIGEWKDYFNER